jgi:hypothetical protein
MGERVYDGSWQAAIEATADAIARRFNKIMGDTIERLQIEGRSPDFIDAVKRKAYQDFEKLMTAELAARAKILSAELPSRSGLLNPTGRRSTSERCGAISKNAADGPR